MAEKPRIHLEPGKYYHLLNRGNNRNVVFQDTEDYERFLCLSDHHISEIGKVYSYALMPDHWHLTVSINSLRTIPTYRLKDKHGLSRVIGHLQNAYAKYYNHKYRRVSSVFEHKFERIHVDTLSYLKRLIVYHHFNPQKHNFIERFEDYPWTSYRTLIGDGETFLVRDKVIEKFNGFEKFIEAHMTYNKEFWQKLSWK